jgi:hypothetical protein
MITPRLPCQCHPNCTTVKQQVVCYDWPVVILQGTHFTESNGHDQPVHGSQHRQSLYLPCLSRRSYNSLHRANFYMSSCCSHKTSMYTLFHSSTTPHIDITPNEAVIRYTAWYVTRPPLSSAASSRCETTSATSRRHDRRTTRLLIRSINAYSRGSLLLGSSRGTIQERHRFIAGYRGSWWEHGALFEG